MAPRPKPQMKPPHPFILEGIAELKPEVRRMFSGYAVYVGDRICMMLRDHKKVPQDNGIWLVLAEGVDPEDAALRRELPSLRPIETIGGKIGHWMLVPSDGADFEREALHCCELMLRKDPRVGRIPMSRR